MESDCYGILGWNADHPTEEMREKAKATKTRALEIDDTLSEGHMVLAFDRWEKWDWAGAEQEHRRAIELNPNSALARQRYSLFLTAMGRNEESLAEIQRALVLDPVSLTINTSLASRLYFARRYDQAIEQCRKTLEMDANFAPAHFQLGQAYVQQARYDEALAAFAKGLPYSKVATMAALGHALGTAGQRTKARRILAEVKEISEQKYVSPYNIAMIYAGLGEADRAMVWIEKACADRVFNLAYLRVDPAFDSLRSDPRFQQVLQRIHLSDRSSKDLQTDKDPLDLSSGAAPSKIHR
jgi:tetratricopeptide (TPR) repeat protein